ncbi:MAG: hypothetical protein ACFFDQ_12700 [Candidatus Thorarchaeota archaeon]
MLERLGVQEFMVLTSGGTPIFHFSNTETRKLDELLSGFLSAITSFAAEFGEKSVQRLSFEGSELLYEQYGTDYLFIFLVESGSSEKVLRVVLRELSKRFVSRYQNELRMDIPVLDVFMDFENDVRGVLSYYEGILVIMSSLSSFVIPKINKDNLDIAIRSGGFLDEFHRDLGNSGNRVLSSIDGKTSIYDLSRNLGLSEIEISEIIEYLAIRGLLRVSKLCPLLIEKDARFDAYLDLIGLPSKDYQLLDRAKSLCNGERSLVDISERLGVVPEQLYDVFEKLGDEVEWKLVEVTGLSDELKS